MARFGLKLWENAFQMIPNISFFDAEKLAKILDKNFHQKNFCQNIDKSPVFEELWLFGRERQMRLQKWPPKLYFSVAYDFWQRCKSGTHQFWSWHSAKNDFKTFGSWLWIEDACVPASLVEDTCVLARRHICLRLAVHRLRWINGFAEAAVWKVRQNHGFCG